MLMGDCMNYRDSSNSTQEVTSILSKGNNIELPKSGGAIQGMNEEVTVNPSMGSCHSSIPLPFLDNRHNFVPPVSILYNSTNGNGVLGIGWELNYPSIARNTSKVLPKYQDESDSDTFVLSGCDELVPFINKNDDGSWSKAVLELGTLTITRYRPRIEKEYLKIERITKGYETYWKVTTENNTVTFFGVTEEYRIFDPKNPKKIFKWLPQFSYDNYGNVIEYRFKRENKDNIRDNVNENGRRDYSNLYLKSIQYGNKIPYYGDLDKPYTPDPVLDIEYYYKIVMDYGEHHDHIPTPTEFRPWNVRKDPFYNYRAGFELSNMRILKRILFFNSFQELSPENTIQPVLVKSMDFSYFYFDDEDSNDNCEVDFLKEVKTLCYEKEADGSYSKQAYPSLKLYFSKPAFNDGEFKTKTLNLSSDNKSKNQIFCDYYNEGLEGILSEEGQSLYYRENLGEGVFSDPLPIGEIPSLKGMADRKIEVGSLEPKGRKFFISMEAEHPGFYEADSSGNLLSFKTFEKVPHIDNNDNTCYIDLDGDGLGELVVFEDGSLTFYPCLGRKGFGEALKIRHLIDQDTAPKLIWQSKEKGFFLADMNGDGLTDIVKITKSTVCYWPNMGYGKFGERVIMDNFTIFESSDQFDAGKVLLTDITGTGACDMVYFGGSALKVYINRGGCSFSKPIDTGVALEGISSEQWTDIDIFGNGVPVLLCYLETAKLNNYLYIDLLNGRKPYLLEKTDNSLGKTTQIYYKSSQKYYLEHKKEGKPWITKLPFPIYCVEEIVMREENSNTLTTNSYNYRHGFYDGDEREFRGFGMVEHLDSETYKEYIKISGETSFEEKFCQTPTLTKTWYHTGAFEVLKEYKKEYFKNTTDFEEAHLSDIEFIECDNIDETTVEIKDTNRALKQLVLRREVYGLDKSVKESIPYEVVERKMIIKKLQPALGKRACYIPLERNVTVYSYEREEENPRIQEAVNITFDCFGNVLETVATSFGTPKFDEFSDVVKLKKQYLYTKFKYTSLIDTASNYRMPKLCEKVSFELNIPYIFGYTDPDIIKSTFEELSTVNFTDNLYLQNGTKKKVRHERTLFYNNSLTSPLTLGEQGDCGLLYRNYILSLDQSILSNVYNNDSDISSLSQLGYLNSTELKKQGVFHDEDEDNCWWIGSEKLNYSQNPEASFFVPVSATDSLGKTSNFIYYKDQKFILSGVIDPLGGKIEISDYDMRFIKPKKLKDMNDNISEVAYDIRGQVTALAYLGKGSEGDNLVGSEGTISEAEMIEFFKEPVLKAGELLNNATERTLYDFSSLPYKCAKLQREFHKGKESAFETSKIFVTVSYFDGLGRVLCEKTLSEPGQVKKLDADNEVTFIDTSPNPRWLTSNRVIYNNKGNPYKVYEPYFCDTHVFRQEKELYLSGISSVHTYDALGRPLRTDFPDGTYEKHEVGAWKITTYDRNDTVSDSEWFSLRQTGELSLDQFEKDAAKKTLAHDLTPILQFVDSRGAGVFIRNIIKTPDRSGESDECTVQFYDTVIENDIFKKPVMVKQPSGIVQERNVYDLAGRLLLKFMADKGEVKILCDALGKPVLSLDIRGIKTRTNYDLLDRVVSVEVLNPDETNWRVAEKTEYAKTSHDAIAKNHVGQVVKHYDQSGVIHNEAFDFKGNVLKTKRTLLDMSIINPDWNFEQSFEEMEYVFEKEYNALNMPVYSKMPDGSAQVFLYNLNMKVDRILGSVLNGDIKELIDGITYNEKGQRIKVIYSNGVETFYKYDSLTYRLENIKSVRTKTDGKVLKDIVYTYDPVGNVTHAEDRVSKTVYFDGTAVASDGDFMYDSMYRLVKAEGREHKGQNLPSDSFDIYRSFTNYPNDGTAMQRYKEYYEYDIRSNMTSVRHICNNSSSCWTRKMTCSEESNYILTEQIGDGAIGNFSYDTSGNITKMPYISSLQWDYKGMLCYSAPSDVSSQSTKYSYDSTGQRVRKMTAYANGITKIRIYLGDFEIYREYSGTALNKERNTIRYCDGESIFCEVDYNNATEDSIIKRYKLYDLMNSTYVEIDEIGKIISYEEYYPFGGTSFRTIDSQTEVSQSRYRYVGKERDEETGLYYFGLRYYAPWLCRWTSTDPKGSEAGNNQYVYCSNNPLRYMDPDGADDEDQVEEKNAKSSDGESSKGEGSKDKPEKRTLLGTILSTIQVLKKGTLLVVGIIKGDKWYEILKNSAKFLKDIWDYLGYVSEGIKEKQNELVDWAKNLGKDVGDWLKRNVWEPVKNFFKGVWNAVKNFFVGLWESIVGLFSSSDSQSKDKQETTSTQSSQEDEEESSVEFDASVDSSGLSLTLKFGNNEISFVIGDGLSLKGKIGGYEFEAGINWSFDKLKYKYGGGFGKKEGEIALSKDQYKRKNSDIYKTSFYWLNFKRYTKIYAGY